MNSGFRETHRRAVPVVNPARARLVAMSESRGGAKRTAVPREDWGAGDAEPPLLDMYV